MSNGQSVGISAPSRNHSAGHRKQRPYSTPHSALVDLHLHTDHSDGRAAPTTVVELAAAAGLQAIAIVDHDVVSGLAEAQAAGQRVGVAVIAGVELTARWRGRTCHVLGYYVDAAETRLTTALADARARAEAAVAAALDALRARGHALTLADLARYRTRYPSPAALLLAMVQRGLLRSRADVRAVLVLLRASGPAWTAEEAIALVHGAGGAAVLAHPGRRVGRVPLDRAALAELAGMGLDGVEVEHPSHTSEQRREYTAIARELHLVTAGGSDWHGRRGEAPPGSGGVDAATLAALQARAARGGARSRKDDHAAQR